MARPTKLTPEVREAVLRALRNGNTREAAANCAGLTLRALYYWMAKGRRAKRGEFFQFFQSVKKAEAGAEIRSVAAVRKAGKTHWQAHAWWLERRRSKDYGRELDRLRNVETRLKKLEKRGGQRGPKPRTPA